MLRSNTPFFESVWTLKRAEREQRSPRCDSLGRVEADSNKHIQRMLILHHLYQWLLRAYLDVPHAIEEWSVLTLPKIQKRSWKDNWPTCTMSSIKWRQGINLWCIHDIPSTIRNSTRIFVSTYTATWQSDRTQKSPHPRSSTDHAKQEAHAEVILGRSSKYCHLPHESVHNIQSARGYPARKVLPGVKKSIATTNEKLCRSTRENNPVSWFCYNDYMAYHYA